MARLVVTVPVTRSCEIDGRAYKRGDRVTLTPIDAAIHARRGHVTLRPGPVVGELEPEISSPSRRTYKRRDLHAEP